MVTLENVSKFIISNFSIHIPQGECVGIIGASGAGKTTLLKLVSGLLKPDSGYVRTLGSNPVRMHGKYGNNLSVFLAGYSALDKTDTVEQNFEILRCINRLSKESFYQEYKKLALQLDFQSYEKEKLQNLSLGQRMRVELGATLVCNPKLLILDEPEVGLDALGKAAFRKLIEQRCQQGMTVLIASHNLQEISKFCTRLALVEKGQLVYYGSEENLCRKYAQIESMHIKVKGKLPDLEDLPMKRYKIENDILQLFYDSTSVSAAEIVGMVLRQTEVEEIRSEKLKLSDIIVQVKD